MGKKNTIILFVVVIVLAIVGGVVTYSYIFRDKGKAITEQTEPDENQPTRVVKSEYVQGTKQIHKGVFVKATDTSISYEEADIVKELPLGDEIMVLCTDQDLNELTIDDNREEFGKIYNPKSVGDITPSNEFIVMVSSYVSGFSTVHTLIFTSDSCPE